ncbi:MAG: glycosyltransferase family 2 protein [Oligoflexia bacterium]|nr:glycosyltransferase family 2 protein [Oligoflexia bacterium]
MRDYFYKLLNNYLKFYIMSGSTIANIFPLNRYFEDFFKKSNIIYNVTSEDLEDLGGKRLESKEKLNVEYVVINSHLHYEQDIQSFLETIRGRMSCSSKLLITYYSMLWRPFFKLASFLGIREKDCEVNWLSHSDVDNLLILSGFERIKRERRIIFPIYLPLLSNFCNRVLVNFSPFSWLCITNIVIALPVKNSDVVLKKKSLPSVSIIVPSRNEEGNIENAIKRIPRMGENDEIIFVEGGSSDSTWDVIDHMKEKYFNKSIYAYKQEGHGKGDAVRLGFSKANNEILMILDADLTVPPEELLKFYNAIVIDKFEFVNGSRLVYPMNKNAMRFFNMIGNKFFALAFTYILGHPFKDTLCGTKVLTKINYQKIAKNRTYFGEFDPFGDFDLIFGASKLCLRTIEIPIKYHERKYGRTNIQRWRHGLILFKMMIFACRKIKFI